MKPIKQTYLINARVADVWQALTNPEIIEEWSGAEAEFEPKPGSEYSLWDGSIGGQVVDVLPPKKLVQTWKPDNWEIEDSVVTFTLKPVGSKTRVELVHENVEEFDYKGTSEGWDLYYVGAIKRMFDAKPAKKTQATKKASTAKGKTAKQKTGTKIKSVVKKKK